MCLVTFALLLVISLRLVAARLLTKAKYHAILLFGVESIKGLIKKGNNRIGSCKPLGVILATLVMLPR